MSDEHGLPFQTTPTVGTFSGRQIDLTAIKPDDIEIIDIAVGLAQQCRYAGQVWPFYSVAEHSVLISRMVPQVPNSSLPLKALLHDAPEFIINDLVRPVKRKVTGYDEIEAVVMEAVEREFDFQYTAADWTVIKHYDDLITISERRALMPRLNPSSYGAGVHESEVPKVKFHCLPPAEAAMAFLSRFFFLAECAPTREQRGLIEIILKGQHR